MPSKSSLTTNSDGPLDGVCMAIIMDGNGRWAAQHNTCVTEGHREGARALHRTTEAALELGVKELTVYGFSTENFERSAVEVAGIMQLFLEEVASEAPIMRDRKSRMCFMGRRDLLGAEIQDQMSWAEQLTATENPKMTLCIAFGYGGRAEIIDAANNALALTPEKTQLLTEESLRACLYRPELRDPDLIVRTAGEKRLSNFLVWQSAYSELVFTDTLWPDFGRDDLEASLLEFARRDRRFGRREEHTFGLEKDAL